MLNDELRALVNALDRIALTHVMTAPDESALESATAYLRACVDAKPVAWMHDRFMSTDYERVQHDEMRNRSCGFQAKPILALYTHPVPASPQAEPKREALSDDEILDIATAAGLRFSMYSDDVETRAAIKRLARAVERAHGIGGSDE